MLGQLYYVHEYLKLIFVSRMSWEEHVTQMGEKRNTYRILVGTPE
jgi:hypothetical protein